VEPTDPSATVLALLALVITAGMASLLTTQRAAPGQSADGVCQSNSR